ncbi:Six-hairpin glycosidase [Polyplosphaeria fusca]|uniref:Six-hairpin glycosidase n=1 Tax=Polyplosphaeria fusca TaxID=682080 RepID=A0A9P4QV93_9PLEO|nr:Six-hairpin glycosidase [Polyplosphaeria fusca]
MLFRVARFERLFLILLAFSASFFALTEATESSDTGRGLLDLNSGYETEDQHVFHPPPTILPTIANTLQDLHSALSTMQDRYFGLWLGKWTTAIDWTAAVMGTHVSSTLSSLSHSLSYTMPGTFHRSRKLDVEAQMVENEINKYFGQITTYYFGEDAFSIRNQAYDDMLWVVLGWLEAIRFINSHSERHYPMAEDIEIEGSEWHGKQFIPSFAHRSRIFYELAEKGWDWELCGGGMVWSPHLGPYKNAITNQLFISASIGMYLYFPGDDNCSPFMKATDEEKFERHVDGKRLRQRNFDSQNACGSRSKDGLSTYDPIYLAAAINGYDWLKNSGMTNDKGLYVDGFHIHDWGKNGSIGTGKCDERDEMVYTYNQGVILSGLRQLWEGTGNITYLEDGHELVRNVIRATGWTDTDIAPAVSFTKSSHTERKSKQPPVLSTDWHGLGSHGILTELCDPSGSCDQNGQTFKGIFFHHLVLFCEPLPRSPVSPGKTHAASREIAKLHQQSCDEYAAWVAHNAEAALNTRDREGRFGMWWSAGARGWEGSVAQGQDLVPEQREREEEDGRGTLVQEKHVIVQGDVNDRGRGRTVETQGGGIAVVKALWEFLRRMGEAEA